MPERSAVADALRGMLARAHQLHPDRLPDVVTDAVHTIGGRDVELHFVDLAQDVLLRASGPGEPELEVDATVAGRAYRNVQTVLVDVDGGTRAWVPLLDGADRLGVLGAVLDAGDAVQLEGLEAIAALTAELVVARSQYGDSLALAKRRRPLSLASELRWAMLPPRTFATERVTISALVEPAYEIAGDHFDYSAVGDTFHLAVFDAMGHGLEASRLVNLVVGAYRSSRRAGHGLDGTYAFIDATVNDQFGDFAFATGVLVELDASTGELRVLRAGHPPPLLFRNGRLIGEIDVAPTLPLGIGDSQASTGTIHLEPDDWVLLYSDGVIEARNAEGEEFGVERLSDFLVRAAASEEPLPETLRRLSKAILAHQETPLEDDATLLLLHWRRPGD
jgi:serine phosphatase RsbU (regulator of sigma subunit)